MAGNVAPKVITDGLLLYLDAANTKSYIGSGTTWTDLSRSSNSGTLVNGPTFSSANGGSIIFDGIDDRVNLSNNLSTNTENSVTVEAFVWLNTNQNSKIFISNYAEIISPTGFALGISDSNNNIVKWFTGNLGTTNTIFSTTTLVNQQYYHAVGTYNGNVKQLYINGILEASSSVSSGINNTSTLASLGYLRYFNNQYFNGRISFAKTYNRALSAAEVLQNYNATKTRYI
jgi:hypothetical protein